MNSHIITDPKPPLLIVICVHKDTSSGLVSTNSQTYGELACTLYTASCAYTHTYCVGLSVHIHGLTHNVHKWTIPILMATQTHHLTHVPVHTAS